MRLVIPEFPGTHMGGHHSEVHQPITGKIYLFPKFLPFKTASFEATGSASSLPERHKPGASFLQDPSLEFAHREGTSKTHLGPQVPLGPQGKSQLSIFSV